MSETTKTAEVTKRATDQAARFTQAAVDTASKATKEAIRETSQIAQTGADRAGEDVQSVAETVVETAEQRRDAITVGVQLAAETGSKVADINLGQSHQLLASLAHAMDLYRDASERSAERAQALLSSYMTFGRGLQEMQQVWLEMFDHTLENVAHKPQDLLRCKTMVEVAEAQRDLYANVINHALASTGRLLDIAGRTAQDAVRPLQSHAH